MGRDDDQLVSPYATYEPHDRSMVGYERIDENECLLKKEEPDERMEAGCLAKDTLYMDATLKVDREDTFGDKKGFGLGEHLLKKEEPDELKKELDCEDTFGDKKGFGLGCLLSLFVNYIADTFLISFLPAECESRGMDYWMIGAIFSAHYCSIFVLAPVFGVLSSQVGPFRLVTAGLLTSAASVLLQSFIPALFSNIWAFGVSLLVVELFKGVGSAAVDTASMGMLMSEFTSSQGQAMAAGEFVIGLASVVGPALGAGLHALGPKSSLMLPCSVVSGLLATTAILMYALHRVTMTPTETEQAASEEQAYSEEEASGQHDPIRICSLSGLTDIPFAFTAIPIVVSISFAVQMSLDPTLGPFLKQKYGLDSTSTSGYFAVFNGSYTVAAVAAGYLADTFSEDRVEFNSNVTILVGLCFVSVSFMLLAPVCTEAQTMSVTLASLFLMGAATGAIIVSSMPCMLAAAERKLPHFDEAIVSGIWVSATGLGAAVGPLTGDLLSGSVGFKGWFLTCASSCAVGMVCILPTILALRQLHNKDSEELQVAPSVEP